MRVSNLDSISNCLDRLITERVKLVFFQRERLTEAVTHQRRMIATLRRKLTELLSEAVRGRYRCLRERRTFRPEDVEGFIDQIETLLAEDLTVGDADRAKLRLAQEVLRCRQANEARSRAKNALEEAVGRLLPPR